MRQKEQRKKDREKKRKKLSNKRTKERKKDRNRERNIDIEKEIGKKFTMKELNRIFLIISDGLRHEKWQTDQPTDQFHECRIRIVWQILCLVKFYIDLFISQSICDDRSQIAVKNLAPDSLDYGYYIGA